MGTAIWGKATRPTKVQRAADVIVPTAGDLRGPTDHMNLRILHSGSMAQTKGIPGFIVCQILMFMWSFGPLDLLSIF